MSHGHLRRQRRFDQTQAAPALCNLAAAKLLTDQFAIIGFAYNDLNTETFRKQLSEEIKEFASCPIPPEMWEWFLKRIYYVRGDFQDPKAYQQLKDQIELAEKEHRTQGNHFYYLAVAPRFFSEVIRQLGAAGLAEERDGHWRAWLSRSHLAAILNPPAPQR